VKRTFHRIGRGRLVFSALWLVLAAFSIWYVVASARYAHVDFIAFYCAGGAVAQGADPYRQMPLNACEHALASGGIYASPVTVPAPLPPYALLGFSVLSRLPFLVAYLAFAALLAGALIAGTLLMRRLGVPPLLTVAAMAYPAVDSLRQGQPVLIVFLAVVLTAWALSRGRDRLAAVCSFAALIEPHIGLPLILALFLWRPKLRLLLVLAAFVSAGLSVAAVGLPVTLEYVTSVLPLHAASELLWVTQLSSAYALAVFGTPARIALELSTIQYFATVALGVYVAGRAARTRRAPELIALIPPLFGALGGPYIHAGLLPVALPIALVVAVRTRRATAYLCLAAIAIVWLSVSEPVDYVLSLATAATIAYVWRANAVVSLVAALCVTAIGIAHYPLQGAVGVAPPVMHIGPSAFAEQSWAQFVSAVNPPGREQLVAFVMKLPTWLGLLGTAWLCVDPLCRAQDSDRPVRPATTSTPP